MMTIYHASPKLSTCMYMYMYDMYQNKTAHCKIQHAILRKVLIMVSTRFYACHHEIHCITMCGVSSIAVGVQILLGETPSIDYFRKELKCQSSYQLLDL